MGIQSVVISISVMAVLGGIFIPKHMKFGKIKNTKELWSVNKAKTQHGTQTKTQTQSLKTAEGEADGNDADNSLESADDFVLALTTLLEKVDDFELTDELQDSVENIISHLNTFEEENEEEDDDEKGEEGGAVEKGEEGDAVEKGEEDDAVEKGGEDDAVEKVEKDDADDAGENGENPKPTE